MSRGCQILAVGAEFVRSDSSFSVEPSVQKSKNSCDSPKLQLVYTNGAVCIPKLQLMYTAVGAVVLKTDFVYMLPSFKIVTYRFIQHPV